MTKTKVEFDQYKVGSSKSDPTLKATTNREVHFAFFNVATMYILGGSEHCISTSKTCN